MQLWGDPRRAYGVFFLITTLCESYGIIKASSRCRTLLKHPCINQTKALYSGAPHATDWILCFSAVIIIIGALEGLVFPLLRLTHRAESDENSPHGRELIILGFTHTVNTNTWLPHLWYEASNTGADFLVYWDSWLLFISKENRMLHHLKISTGRVFAAHTTFSNNNLHYWRPISDQTGGILPSWPVACLVFISWHWQEFRIDIVTTVRGGRKTKAHPPARLIFYCKCFIMWIFLGQTHFHSSRDTDHFFSA